MIEIMVMLITTIGTFFVLLIFINWLLTKLGVIQPEVYKPDGNLYLHVGNESKTIFLGHDRIITLCRGGYKEGYENYLNLTCEERFEGCGAVNCECWVN